MLERTESTAPSRPVPGLPQIALPVPDGFLGLPSVGDRERVLRFESGMALDPHLRRLARLSGAVDRGLAHRLLGLRRSSGYLRLGKACFGDYVRERVGVAERTAQEWVRLGRGLERLPVLDGALRDGRLTWTAAAQVARVSGVDDQAEWVRRAERLSVRELKARVDDTLVRRNARRQDDASEPAADPVPAADSTSTIDAGAVADSDSNSEHGADSKTRSARDSDDSTQGLLDLDRDDRPVKLRLLTSKRTSHLWEAALELCELVAGSPLAPSEAPEYALADFLSGTQPVGDDVRAFPARPPRKHDDCVGKARGSNRVAYLPGPTERLGGRRVRFAPTELSAEILQVMDLLEGEIPRDPVQLDTSIRALMAARRGLDLDLARMLRTFHWLGLARDLGFRSFTAYVEERLNISADRARFLVRLDRSLTDFGLIQNAVRLGRIGSVAALLVSRVASPGRSESAWLERARKVSVLRLRKEVQWAERRNAQGRCRTALPPSTGPLPSALQTLTMALLADEDLQLHPFEGARAWLRCDGDDAASSMTPADCETFAGSDAEGERSETSADPLDRETFADDASSRHPCRGDGHAGHVDRAAMAEAIRVFRELIASHEGPEGDIAVEFWVRRSALDLWVEARRRLSVAAGRALVSDAEVLHEVALSFLITHLRSWLEAVRDGDPTAVRDRFVCQVPGCTMRAGAGHHLRFRSDLGPDEPWNLLFICWGHHLIGIHGGPWIRVTGRAPDALTAQLGLLPGGAALESWVRDVPSHTPRKCA